MRHDRKFPRTSWSALLAMLLLATLGACAPQTEQAPENAPEDDIEARAQAPEVEVEPAITERGAGTFELILGGDLEIVHAGTASCVLAESTGELRASLDPRGPSDHRFYVLVPDYDGETGTYLGQMQVSGAARSAGPVDAAITRETGEDGVFEPQVTLAFQGTYAGEAGTGTAEGEVICSLPNGGESLIDAEPEVEDEP